MPKSTNALPAETSNSHALKYLHRNKMITNVQYVEAWKALNALKRNPSMELPEELNEVWEMMYLLRRPALSKTVH